MTEQESPGSPTTAVVVVNFGSHALLETNLAAFRGADAIRVVVVDNFHSPGERELITALSERHGWHLVTPATNLGFGVGCNLGAEAAAGIGADVVLFLNPDAALPPDGVRELARIVRAHPRAMVSPMIRKADGGNWFSGSEVDPKTGRVRRSRGDFRPRSPWSWLSGAALAVRTSWWREIRGFDPEYFLYWEDVDVSRRCVDRGGQLMLARDVEAFHEPGGTQAQESSIGKSATYYYYNCRNRLLYGSRHLTRSQLFGWLWHTPVESARIYLRGGRRQLVAHPTRMFAAVRGTGSGVAIVVRRLLARPVTRA